MVLNSERGNWSTLSYCSSWYQIIAVAVSRTSSGNAGGKENERTFIMNGGDDDPLRVRGTADSPELDMRGK
ncbi:hypothetical protein P5673_011152 [Acropora cervicornis]|uniref:Uncharacterized protein n=1 Tax=Acropora cervicornis TaxID=6130 RepID=A0AAD9V8H7_ACRCE|nr:hypothetical protein P5673_011152 [Acropora cervicornis]